MLEDAKRVADAQKKKEAEQAALKKAKEKEFALQQAAIEAKRRKEEEELEKAAAALAAKQYAEELKLNEERAIAAKKAKKAAIAAAKEKAEKQAAFAKELQIMQEKVLQAAAERNKELAAKDAERKRLQAIKKEEMKKANEIARAEAEARQAKALQAYYDALQKKRDDFDAKNAALAARRAILQVEIDKQLKEKIMMQERAEHDRKRTLEQANARREKHIQEILKKADYKAKLLKEYKIRQEQERLKKNVQTNLEYTKAMFIVNQTTRKQALHRRQLLSHIEKATERIRVLMETRTKIQKARQLAEAQMMWAEGRE
ncbi:hypothetical protein M758_3G051600 [Ceratodon purpureus]|nr:hypothetical protein M758_3G051600 [Ceratodon purpureus]